MANTYQNILKAGNYENYKALETKDPNVLYFCEDVGKIFKGEVDYTDHVIVAPTKPTTPVVGKLYILSDTNTVEAYVNGNWKVISYPLADKIDEDSDDLHAVTAKAVYEALKNITNNGILSDAIVSVYRTFDNKPASLAIRFINDTDEDEDTEFTIPGVVLEPKWESDIRRLTLPVTAPDSSNENAVQDIVIDFGKDIFLDPNADNGYNKDTNTIDLYLNDASETDNPTLVRIPVADFVDSLKLREVVGCNTEHDGLNVFVAGDGDSDTDIIHVELQLDPNINNALTLSGNGLMVDLSNYVIQDAFDELCEEVDSLAKATTKWGAF